MIKHTQKIEINADLNKVWFFLMNFSNSLIFDKYYTKIVLPSNYSVNENLIFKIYAKYFFQLKQYKATVVQCMPPQSLFLNIQNNKKHGYQHQKFFILNQIGSKTILTYKHLGTFNSLIMNLFSYVFIKSCCLNELKFIKKSIESTEINLDNEKFNPMKL